MSQVVEFETVFARIVDAEKGYVNLPSDPGGETKYGISKRSYPDEDIKNMTLERAQFLWYRDFWKPCAVGVADSIKYQLCDAAYHHSFGNAIRMLQRAVGALDDGHWGRISDAAYRAKDENDCLLLFLAERQEFMCRLEKFTEFGRGWSRRIARNLRYAAADN